MNFQPQDTDIHDEKTPSKSGAPLIHDESTSVSFPLNHNDILEQRQETKGDPFKTVYDPYDYGNVDSASSSLRVIIYILLFSFGPSLFSIPYPFVFAGYVAGIIESFITVLLYAHCVRLVMSTEYELCKRYVKPNMTYTEMTRRAFECGPARLRWFSKYTERSLYVVFICNWTIGTSCMFLLASENSKRAYELLFDTNVEVRTVMLYLLVPITLLWWIPNLKLLLSFSIFPNLVNVAYIGIVVYYTFQELPPLSSRNMVGNVESVALFTGVMLFSLNITGLVIPLKNEMRKPKKFNSRIGVITLSYCLVTIIYSVFGFICYLKYGDQLLESVVWNLPSTDLTKVTLTIFAIGNWFFVPLSGYVPYDIIWNTILKKKLGKSKFRVHYDYACRTFIAFMTITIAFVLPKIELFMLLTGTVCSSIDSLIVPALAQTLIYYKQPKYMLHFKNGVIITIGVVLMIMGGVDSIRRLLT